MIRIGEEIPFAKRGRYGVVHGSVEQHFRPYHLMVETGNKDDLTEAELVQKVNMICPKLELTYNCINEAKLFIILFINIIRATTVSFFYIIHKSL